MERDLGTPLEWVAVAHYNMEHPHVHLALRGVGVDGRPIRLSRDYVRQGIREIAKDLCTRQLGYRTDLDAAIAQRGRYISTATRPIGPSSAMPKLLKEWTPRFFTVTKDPSGVGLSRGVPLLECHAAERLKVLESMGLAESISPNP